MRPRGKISADARVLSIGPVGPASQGTKRLIMLTLVSPCVFGGGGVKIYLVAAHRVRYARGEGIRKYDSLRKGEGLMTTTLSV